MVAVFDPDDMRAKGRTRYWQGQAAESSVSLIVVDMDPGEGPALHTHPYEEVFVMIEGEATFTVVENGEERSIELHEGQIAVVPADTPHRFVNSGAGRLRQVDIQPSGHYETVWLDR